MVTLDPDEFGFRLGPIIGSDGHQVSVFLGGVSRVLVVRRTVEGQFPVGVDGEFITVSPRQHPFIDPHGRVQALQGVRGHRFLAILGIVDGGWTVYLQRFDRLVGDGDSYIEEGLGRITPAPMLGVVDMEVERVRAIPIVVTRVLVVRRLR